MWTDWVSLLLSTQHCAFCVNVQNTSSAAPPRDSLSGTWHENIMSAWHENITSLYILPGWDWKDLFSYVLKLQFVASDNCRWKIIFSIRGTKGHWEASRKNLVARGRPAWPHPLVTEGACFLLHARKNTPLQLPVCFSIAVAKWEDILAPSIESHQLLFKQEHWPAKINYKLVTINAWLWPTASVWP